LNESCFDYFEIKDGLGFAGSSVRRTMVFGYALFVSLWVVIGLGSKLSEMFDIVGKAGYICWVVICTDIDCYCDLRVLDLGGLYHDQLEMVG